MCLWPAHISTEFLKSLKSLFLPQVLSVIEEVLSLGAPALMQQAGAVESKAEAAPQAQQVCRARGGGWSAAGEWLAPRARRLRKGCCGTTGQSAMWGPACRERLWGAPLPG